MLYAAQAGKPDREALAMADPLLQRVSAVWLTEDTEITRSLTKESEKWNDMTFENRHHHKNQRREEGESE